MTVFYHVYASVTEGKDKMFTMYNFYSVHCVHRRYTAMCLRFYYCHTPLKWIFRFFVYFSFWLTGIFRSVLSFCHRRTLISIYLIKKCAIYAATTKKLISHIEQKIGAKMKFKCKPTCRQLQIIKRRWRPQSTIVHTSIEQINELIAIYGKQKPI